MLTLGFTALTVRTAVHQLGSVTSLSDLVGTANLAPVPAAAGPPASACGSCRAGQSKLDPSGS